MDFLLEDGGICALGTMNSRTHPPVNIREGLAAIFPRKPVCHLGRVPVRVPDSPAVAHPASKTSGLC